MTAIFKAIIDRILANPKTTISAIVPLLVAAGLKFGFSIPVETLTEVLTALYALILLFIKDFKKVEDTPAVDKSTVAAVSVPTSAKTSTTFDVSGIVSGNKGSDN